jgi:hypothetical protein
MNVNLKGKKETPPKQPKWFRTYVATHQNLSPGQIS